MKKIFCKVSVAYGMLLGGSLLFASDFDGVNDIVSDGSDAVQTTAGTGLTILIAFLPVIMLAVGFFLGWKQAKKKAEQEQEDSNKPMVWGGIGAVAGSLLAILVIALMGTVLMGDSAKGIKVLTDYWQMALLGGAVTNP